MKLFGLHLGTQSSLERLVEAQVKSSLSAATRAFLTGSDANAGGTTLTNALVQSTWVFSAIGLLAETVAGLDLYFEQNERPVERGPLVDLFRRPHPQMNRFTFIELVVTWQQLRGEAFVVPTNERNEVLNLANKGAAKQVRRLHVLPPDGFREVVTDNVLEGWQFTGNNRDTSLGSQEFLPGEVLHFPLPNPFNRWRGLAPLTVARLAAQTDYASAQFMKGLVENNADTGVIVSTDQILGTEQQDQIKAALRERKRKAGTADLPLFLFGGAKVEKPSLSSADMQFLENRKFNRQEICAVFRVPQELLGYTEDANRSVGEASRQNFIEHRISPYCARLVAGFEPLAQAHGVEMGFAVEDHPTMQAARRARFTTAKDVMGTMGVPIGVLDDVFGLGLPDNLPHRNVVFLPFNLMPYGNAEGGTGNAEANPQPSNDGNDAAAADAAKMFERLEKGLSALTPRSALPVPRSIPVHQCAGAADYEAAILGSIKVKRDKLSRFFFEQRARVLAKLETGLRSLASGIGQKALIDEIFDLPFEQATLLARINPLIRSDLTFGLKQVAEEIATPLFDVPPADAIRFLNERQPVIAGINETTFNDLKGQLQQGLEAGETTQQLADRVRATFNVAQGRAETIAITETNVAVNSGRLVAMEQAQVDLKAWLSSRTENARPAHALAEQVYENGIPLTEPFIVGGEAMMAPGDPQASPGNTVNCKCHVIAVRGGKAFKQVTFTFEKFLSQGGGK